MTFHIIQTEGGRLVASDRAVIKRRDRHSFVGAMALLSEAQSIRAASIDAQEAARGQGLAQGLGEARDSAEALLADGLAELAQKIERDAIGRRAELADVAFAATRAMVGALGDERAMIGVVERTLGDFESGQPVTIAVAPAMEAQIRARVDGLEHVKVSADPALGATDCHFISGKGQTIASLSVQFDALAARWGLASA
jgi:flagellar biosynthesis/type III secretory pathway protein FliH